MADNTNSDNTHTNNNTNNNSNNNYDFILSEKHDQVRSYRSSRNRDLNQRSNHNDNVNHNHNDPRNMNHQHNHNYHNNHYDKRNNYRNNNHNNNNNNNNNSRFNPYNKRPSYTMNNNNHNSNNISNNSYRNNNNGDDYRRRNSYNNNNSYNNQSQWDDDSSRRNQYNNRYNDQSSTYANNNNNNNNSNNSNSMDRQLKRVYAGNLPQGLPEESLVDFLNTIMIKHEETKSSDFKQKFYVLSAMINRERNFAFIECISPDIATELLGFDGIDLGGQSLRLRRPKEYNGPIDRHIGKYVNKNSSTSENNVNDKKITVTINGKVEQILAFVHDSEDKLYIGGLPNFLTDEQVIELLSAFGKVKSFNLIKDYNHNPPRSKGFAFCEYEDNNVVDSACKGLTGMELGDKKLIVQRAGSPQQRDSQRTSISNSKWNDSDNNLNNNTLNEKKNNNLNEIYENSISGIISLERIINKIKELDLETNSNGSDEIHKENIEKITPRILVLMNLFSLQDLNNNEELDDMINDVINEASKFGNVGNAIFPRPNKNSNENEPKGLGRVYLEFEQASSCLDAAIGLAGRLYNQRLVVTSFYDLDRFYKKDL